MAKVSILIPAINETIEASPGVTVLQRTIQEIYQKATGEFEVIIGIDGPPFEDFPPLPNLTVIKRPERVGLKINVNDMAQRATGKYLFKLDAHCKLDEGFDEKLQADMEDNWIVTPRFYVLDNETWEWQDERFYDYFFLYWPFNDHDHYMKFKNGGHWPQKTKEKLDIPIDETPQFHGSAWFIGRDYFLNSLGGFPTYHRFSHAQEPPELGLRTWLGLWGGKVMVNKKTWYAHMHKGSQRPVGWTITPEQTRDTYDYSARYWMGNQWEGRARDMEWFADKFNPMPTWPDDWKEKYHKWLAEQAPEKPIANRSPVPDKKLKNRTELAKYFAKLGFTKGAEIGVAEGRYSEILCQSIPNLQLMAVDNYPGRHLGAKAEAETRLKTFNVDIVIKSSVETAKDTPDDSLDFVFIDACHAYNCVKEDINAWAPKVRPGGIVSGHDYYASRSGQVGVIRAVDEYIAKHGHELKLTDWDRQNPVRDDRQPCWYFFKPKKAVA